VHECPIDHPALPTLFDPAVPDNPVLWAVLRGRHAGRAWVDDVREPSQCVLRTDALLTFVSRHISQNFLDAAIPQLRRTGSLWLVWPPEMSSRLIAPAATGVTTRLEFYDYDPQSRRLSDLRARLPEGFEIQPIDRDLLQRCEWRSDMEFFCGSLDNFLANGIGLCLMQGDEIICEAYASSLGETHAEIGAVTREAYRGRGYAPVTCAFLIKVCEGRGYQAYWSCDADNLASIRVARKLGFRQEKSYQILEYSALS
jgi:RimJ/RimL family protein N-acetyltransferase